MLSALSGVKGDDIPYYPGELYSFSKSVEHYEGLKAYYGFYRNDIDAESVASGGAATALAHRFIENCGIVFGVSYADDYKHAKYLAIDNLNDLKKLKGSKYISAEKKINGKHVFEMVAQCLQDSRKVLFIGLPCEVGSLLFWLQKRSISTENLVTVDLICHGPTLQEVQKQFVEKLEHRYHSHVVTFTTRYAKNRWSFPYIRVEFENGKVYMRPLYETDFGFALNYYPRNSCFNCQFKGCNHAADTTIGDYWGLTPNSAEYNPKGVSALIVRDEKGELLTNSIASDDFILKEADAKHIISHNPMYEYSTKKFKYYDTFANDLEKYGLEKAVRGNPQYKIYRKAALKKRIKLLLNKI